MEKHKKISDKELENIWKRILKVLNSGEKKIIFDSRNNLKGKVLPSVDKKPDAIVLNPQKDILPTLVHECLHIIFPELPENKIENLTLQVSDRISPARFKTLAVKLVDCLFIK